MKKSLLFLPLGLLFICSGFAFMSDLNWTTNLDEAKAKAVKEDKVILLSFQGSDWCGSCMKLEKALFKSEEFKGFAEKELVLLKADFPMRKANKLSKEQTAHNEALADKFNKKGAFPLVIVLSEKGEKIGEMGYPLTSANDYIESLKGIIK